MAKSKTTTPAPQIANLDAFKAEDSQQQRIEIYLIEESPFNPRKTYSQDALQQLADSIKEMGVIQPIRVRPAKVLANGDKDEDRIDGYEIIFGHRRFRAAKLAGEKTIPALVSVLTDAEAARLQAVENLQREDLDPIEEAEGYADYIKTHGVTKDQLAEHISKSRTYIYNRLKLATLCEEGRKHVRAGDLDAELATEIARLPTEELQTKALQEVILGCPEEDEPADFMNYRDGRERIEDKFKRHLDKAKFDRLGLWLVPDRGACESCPERAGNIPELQATGKRADVCTNPGCFDLKTQAHFDAMVAAVEKTGATVIRGAEARAMLVQWSDVPQLDYYSHSYLELDKATYKIEGKTPRDALGKKLKTADVVHVLDERLGMMLECVALETLIKHKVIEAPVEEEEDPEDDEDETPQETRTPEEIAAEQAAWVRKGKVDDAMRVKTFHYTSYLLKTAERRPGDISAILLTLFEASYYAADNEETICEFDDWLRPQNPELADLYTSWAGGIARQERTAKAWQWLTSLDAEAQGRMCIELALFNCPADRASEDVSPDLLMTVAEQYGVDAALIRKQAEEEVDAAEAAGVEA